MLDAELVRSALGAVVRWVWVEDSFCGHRPEPLLAERLWVVPRPLTAAEAEGRFGRYRAGLDRVGNIVIVGPGDYEPGDWPWLLVDVVTYEPGWVIAHLAEGMVEVRTALDELGRPVETGYLGVDASSESYEYGGDGRLVAIEESRGLSRAVRACHRWPPWGGRLEVAHDDDGVSSVRLVDGRVIWSREDTAWSSLLAAHVERIVEALVPRIAGEIHARGGRDGDEVFAIVLQYTAQGPFNVDVVVVLEADRRAWLAAGADVDEQLAMVAPVTRSCWTDDDSRHNEDLLRAGCMTVSESDPYNEIVDAVVAAMRVRGWGPMLTPAAGFAIWKSEY